VVRACGQERIIAPLGRGWFSFFRGTPTVRNDFLEHFCSRLEVLTHGVNDVPIAAHARREGLTLVRNNVREFERVGGLLWENGV
jgi:virulence-associated protein VagC